MKKGDMVIMTVLLIVIGGFVFNQLFQREENKPGAFAEITVDGKHYDTVALTEEIHEIKIETNRGLNLLQISDHGIEMHEADCPDKLCIGFGHIYAVGKKIVCLPNRIFVEIIGEGGERGGGLDAVVS